MNRRQFESWLRWMARRDLEAVERIRAELESRKQSDAAEQSPEGLLARSDKMAVHQLLMSFGEEWRRKGDSYVVNGRRFLVVRQPWTGAAPDKKMLYYQPKPRFNI